MSQFNNFHANNAFACVEDSQLFTELIDEQGAMVEGGAKVILFEREKFQGKATIIEGPMEDLKSVGLDDQVSSMIVLEGQWEFYEDSKFKSPYQQTLGPGVYASVEDVNIKNDAMSSLQPLFSIPRA